MIGRPAEPISRLLLDKRIIGPMSTQTETHDQMLELFDDNVVTPSPPTPKGRIGRVLMIALAAVTFVAVSALAVYLLLDTLMFSAIAGAGH